MVATCSTPKYISIHAPTRGATVGDAICLYELIISIHAPTRGATSYTGGYGGSVTDFNPRSHEGSDGIVTHSLHLRQIFQSTLPRGERRQTMKSAWQPTDFNPRSHEGSDNLFHFVSPNCSISIHAPTRGATTFPSTVIPTLF